MSLVVGLDGKVECPECGERIKVGAAGAGNIARHRNSEKCNKNKRKKKAESSQKKISFFPAFSQPKPVAVPSLVSAPSASTSATPISAAPKQAAAIPHTPISRSAQQGDSALEKTLLKNFQKQILRLPADIPEADDSHELAQFSGDISQMMIIDESEDAWEMWDPILNRLLQRPKEELRALVRRGEKGLLALHRLLEALVQSHGVSEALFEGKVGRLMEVMSDV